MVLAILMVIVSFSLLAPFPAGAGAGNDICVQKSSLCRALNEKGFGDEQITKIFSDERITLYPEILEKKGKGLNYFNKKFGLLTPESVLRGKNIMRDNRTLLTSIGDRYDVEPEVLVAVYRVETNFGGYVGTRPIFNSLLTMTLIENRRSEWAEKELVGLFVLSRMNNYDPLSIKGSWAGAFGLCQFVPTSVLNWGMDGDGDGTVNLFRFPDAMESVANYLKSHGWQPGDREAKRKALWAYNHCDNYIDAVLAYAEALKNPVAKSPKPKKTAKARKIRARSRS